MAQEVAWANEDLAQVQVEWARRQALGPALDARYVLPVVAALHEQRRRHRRIRWARIERDQDEPDFRVAFLEQSILQDTDHMHPQTSTSTALRNMRLTQDFDRKVEDMKPSKRYASSFLILASLPAF